MPCGSGMLWKLPMIRSVVMQVRQFGDKNDFMISGLSNVCLLLGTGLRYYPPAKKCKLDSPWMGPYLVVSLAASLPTCWVLVLCVTLRRGPPPPQCQMPSCSGLIFGSRPLHNILRSHYRMARGCPEKT